MTIGHVVSLALELTRLLLAVFPTESIAAWPVIWVAVVAAALAAVCYFSGGRQQVRRARQWWQIVRKNEWGVRLADSIAACGLIHMENRYPDAPNSQLPDHAVYSRAQRQVALVGIALNRVVTEHTATLLGLLDRGVDIRLMVLHPSGEAIKEYSRPRDKRMERVDSAKHVQLTVQAVRDKGLHRRPNFQLRFLADLPSFTGLLVDGDIEPAGALPDDGHGVASVQPIGEFFHDRCGTVFSFRKRPGEKYCPYEYFAGDFRDLWATARTDEKLLPRRESDR